jgi:rabenosyn-5
VSLPLMSSSGSTAAAASASTRLICPICNEQMMTLLQLNRHLDDVHANLEDGEQVQVKNWFQAQVDKARRFTPLAVLNQKIRALDVFESNGPAAASNSASPGASPSPTPAKQANGVAAEQPVPQARPRDPEEDVTRSHWQRPGYADVCSDTLCEKRLGSANGSVNCRKCGKLFCEDHTMYQMKLSRSAKHDPVRGVWCRVCETCYKSREGYNDNRGLCMQVGYGFSDRLVGFERNHTEDFITIRQKSVDKLHLETSRLEKRLSRLTQLLANPPDVVEPEGRGILWTFGGNRNQQRVLEQSIIAWEEDTAVARCRFCQQEFSNYSLRRHHCRLCGRVVCGDVQTECSSLVGLNVVNGIELLFSAMPGG